VSTRAIIFDFGNVISFIDYARVGKNVAVLSSSVLSAEEIGRLVSAGEALIDFETGILSTAAFLQSIRERFDVTHASNEQLIAAWCDMFTPNQAVIEVIKKIPADIALVLGSTTNPIHFEYYRKQFADALDRFKGFVTSFEVGVLKPDPKFYQECVKVAGCTAEECLYFDDVPHYAEAAAKLGIDSVVYSPAVDVEAELNQRGITLN